MRADAGDLAFPIRKYLQSYRGAFSLQIIIAASTGATSAPAAAANSLCCHPVGLGRSQLDPVTDAKSWGNNRENGVVREEGAPSWEPRTWLTVQVSNLVRIRVH